MYGSLHLLIVLAFVLSQRQEVMQSAPSTSVVSSVFTSWPLPSPPHSFSSSNVRLISTSNFSTLLTHSTVFFTQCAIIIIPQIFVVVFAVVLAFICQRYRGQRQPRFKASLDISKPTLSINTSHTSQETAASSSYSSSSSAFDIS